MSQVINDPASRLPSPTFPASRSARSDHTAEMPRREAETRSARDRFAAKLERESEKEPGIGRRQSGSGNPLGNALAGLDESYDQGRSGGGLAGDHGSALFDQGLAALNTSALIGGVEAALAPSQVAGTPDTTMLERMAAQIAESWPSAPMQSAIIEFPDNSLVQSALVSREPDGSLAIRIAGLDPRIAALQSARLQLELANALAQRRLRLASLQFDKAAPYQRSRELLPPASRSGAT